MPILMQDLLNALLHPLSVAFMLCSTSSNEGTLVSALEKNCLSNKGITFITGAHQEDFISYRSLYESALGSLSHLQKSGLKPGDELFIQTEDNKSLLQLFWACLLGGIIPVPLTAGGPNESQAKLFNAWEQVKNPYLVIDAEHLARLAQYGANNGLTQPFQIIASRTLLVKEILVGLETATPIPIRPEDIAFVQYSSGSTGAPKGVTLKHSNVLANCSDILSRSVITDSDTMFSWMPLTHDMGLIGVHLTGVLAQVNQFIMPTLLFIRRPGLWMEKASQHRISLLYSPNFGLEYFLASFQAAAVNG